MDIMEAYPCPSEATSKLRVIKVVGVGGGGSNAVNRMIRAELSASSSSR